MRYFLRLVAVVLVCLPAWTAAQDLPDFTSTTVNDFALVLTPETASELDLMLGQAAQERGLEMTVVTIDSINDYRPGASIETFAKDLFNFWQVGNAERNDGILMLVAIQDRKMRIALGSGYPAIYDGVAKRIIDTELLPEFRAGDYNAGILKGTRAALEDIYLPDRSSTRSDRWDAERRVLSDGINSNPVLSFAAKALAALAALWGGVLYYRRRPRKCPTCGRRMTLLGDVQEDAYLDDSQLLEEQLKSKNYDVWQCTTDDTLKIVGRRKWFSRYVSCPNCKSHTCEVETFTQIAATRSSLGKGTRVHRCRNCDYEKSTPIVIPMLIDSDNGRSGGGGSSSSGGGGFGGGGSSGGGASGSW